MTDIDFRAIGKRIRIARIKAEYTQERLANTLQLSPTHISNIERGNAHLSLTTLVRIANVLHVNSDELLCDTILYSQKAYQSQIAQLTEDCDEYEIRILEKVIASTLEALREEQTYRQLNPNPSPRKQ